MLMNEQQQHVIKMVISHFSAYCNQKPELLTTNTDVRVLTEHNIYKLHTILIQLHRKLEVEPIYIMEKAFIIFKSLEDVILYFVTLVEEKVK